jgi:AIPR protein
MKNNIIVSNEGTPIELPFFSIRNTTCPEDKDNGRTVLVGKLPFESIVGLPTDQNVRGYLLEAEGLQRRRPSQVHRDILNTLQTAPENFSVLSGGIVLIARNYEIDEKLKVLKLFDPSIINGSQTQGVIKDFINDSKASHLELPKIHISCEIVVSDDPELIASIAISRNFQNEVMLLSIAGRLKQLDELDNALQEHNPELKLQKNETQRSDEYAQTERLLQVIIALTPDVLWIPPVSSGDMPNKTFTYSAKSKCLRMFQEIYKKAKDESDPQHQRYLDLYQFYLDIIGEAYELHKKWKSHNGFVGTQLKNGFKRDERNNITEVPDGIVFPILAALSVFATKTDAGWKIIYPRQFNDADLINSVKPAFIEIAGSNPNVMGKKLACYTQLHQITSLYKKLSE